MSSQTATKKYKPSKNDPELLAFAVDVLKLARKWSTRRVGNAFGVTRQAMDLHVNKKKRDHDA